jgi:membrane associated rhomboid family serine protease
MFPLRDTIKARSFPVVNLGLIGLNILIFLCEDALSPARLESLFCVAGLIPSHLSLAHPVSLITLISSAFLHGGWFHLISNMWMLFIFGDNVEDRMGAGRYLCFYLLSGILSGLAQAFFLPQSSMPTIGASGAIAGVLGAYLILFPRARVTTFIPVFILPWLVDVPAFLFLGFWFLTQLSSGLLSLGAVARFGGIAWWAHIGGFAFGMILALLFARKGSAPRRLNTDENWPW